MKSKCTFAIFFALIGFFQKAHAQPTQLNEHFHELNTILNDSTPPVNFDQSILDELGAGFDTFSLHLPGLGLPGEDQDTLLNYLGWLFDILNNNSDSLNGIFGEYQDSLHFDSSNWNVNIIGYDSLTNAGNINLEGPFHAIGDPANPQVPKDIGKALRDLFDVHLFPDIELAFGTQKAEFTYWGYTYEKTAKVIRVGSVPRFNREVNNNNGQAHVIPIEARWHVEASWFNGSIPNGPGDANPSQEQEPSFDPLLLYGDYALTATPRIGKLGRTSFRLLASLGSEFGTYAPAHQDFDQPFTSVNQGFTTGVGAQMGAGFAFTTGQLTVYSMATYSHGHTLKSAQPYPYDNTRYEVGMRYGKIVNVRYSSGFTSWQTNGNRQADIKNQLTVGLIISELHR